MCVDLSGNNNSGLVTGHLCFASDVKVCFISLSVYGAFVFILIMVTYAVV